MTRRSVLIGLILVQAVLLYLTASSIASNGALYGCSVLCGRSSASTMLPLVASAFGVALFALPAVIGALCQGWQSAVALATAPWWLAVLAHARTLLAPYIGLGGAGGRFAPPFWLDPARLSCSCSRSRSSPFWDGSAGSHAGRFVSSWHVPLSDASSPCPSAPLHLWLARSLFDVHPTVVVRRIVPQHRVRHRWLAVLPQIAQHF